MTWLQPDIARDLHQENIEPGLRLHPSIEAGLPRKEITEITDHPTPTREIHTERDLRENPGEKPQLTKPMTLQIDITGNPAFLDRRLLEDPGLQEPEVKTAGLLLHPVRQAEEAVEKAITSQEVMEPPQEL